ncbi:axonemal dynein light intermediate polypeptide 1 isoform X2 [Mobula hypostoma]|uniref:axonemal dynein light intermediate polypeptide 1 isoform X2 n=1 Tax=Mobula hypostoma TaxID=723540 RepID=UPI002FC32EF3
MIPPIDSLLKYDHPLLISRNTEKKSAKARALKASPQQPISTSPIPSPPKPKPLSIDATKQTEEILNAILPPREWMENSQMWIQQVSSTPCTRIDVVHLQEQLDTKLQQRQARETGICPVRRELYSQCFDELIRQVTINCAERGLLLLRVRDEIRMTISAYQTLYESSVAFGMRKALQAEEGKTDMEKKISYVSLARLLIWKQKRKIWRDSSMNRKQSVKQSRKGRMKGGKWRRRSMQRKFSFSNEPISN